MPDEALPNFTLAPIALARKCKNWRHRGADHHILHPVQSKSALGVFNQRNGPFLTDSRNITNPGCVCLMNSQV